MKKFLRPLIVAACLVGTSACAEEVPFSSQLITSETTLPETATDSRDDGVLRDGTGRPVSHALLGERLPDFRATMVAGDSFDPEMLAGRWTVMPVWGVWCHDSRNDMGNIADLAARLAENPDIDFVSLHVPQNADTLDKMYRDHGSVSGFFEARGVSFPTVLDETADLRAAMQINWTPSYLVIGPDLTVTGFRTDLSKSGEGAVEAFLAELEGLID